MFTKLAKSLVWTGLDVEIESKPACLVVKVFDPQELEERIEYIHTEWATMREIEQEIGRIVRTFSEQLINGTNP